MSDARVIEYDSYGPADVLVKRNKPIPEVLGARQLLIRVIAASVNPKDTFVRKGRFRMMTGDTFPRRVGFDFAGVVEQVGDEATDVAVGSAVFGMLNGWDGGACADWVLASVDEIAPMPANLSFAKAAAVPLAALTALQALRNIGEVTAGKSLCVNGASGGVGLFAVQIAKALGATVTAVASGANEALCREAGADAFVDYSSRDPFGSGHAPFDVVFDVFGSRSLAEATLALSEHGIYVSTVPSPQIMQDVAATSGSHERRARLVVVEANRADLLILADMATRGQLRPHLDATYALDAVSDAHRHVEGKHTRGKVVVSMER